MTYKLSSFNYYISCENGSLRLYNSMSGTDSLLVVEQDIKESVLAVMTGISSVNTLPEHIKRALLDYGYLIPSDRDENHMLEIKTIKTVMNERYLYLVIMPTEDCNFRCKYCYETYEKKKMSKALQDAIINYVRKNITKYSGLSVSWFGGEPLMALDIIEYLAENFIKICKASKRVYMSGITTNGYGLTQEVFEKLYKLKVLSYQVTLDGFKTQHDSQRMLEDGSGTFDRIVDNLTAIKNIKAFGTSFSIRTNYTKSILANIDEFLSFFKKTFNDDSRFGLYIQQASNYGGERIYAFSEELLEPSHLKVLNKMKEHDITLKKSSHFYELNCESGTCYASKDNSIVIGSDGTLYKCTVHFDMPDNIVGKLNEDGFAEFNENYSKWITPTHKAMDKCVSCFNRARCLPMRCQYGVVASGDWVCPPMGQKHIGNYLERFDDSLFHHLNSHE